MANLKDLIVNGAARIIGKVYSSGGFVGNLEGNATNDSAGQQINTTYIKGLSVSGKTITFTKGNGATDTITTQDTNTTYTIASGDNNGQIKVTPSSGSAYNVGVKGLDTAAYKSVEYFAAAHSHPYLSTSGGAMTGNISYTGSKATYTMIKFLNNTADNYGNGISIGGGGATVIGGGESADTVIAGLGISGGDERMLISNDAAIDFYTNCQSGFGSAKLITMNTDGTITASGFNGTATKATQDGNGNTITTTYGNRGAANTWSAVNTFTNNATPGSGSTSAVGAIIASNGGIWAKQGIYGNKVYNAVWNDLADCIEVDKDCTPIPGYCYCFDGERYYKSTKYMDDGIIGLHSDTYGIHMGSKPGCNLLDVAVAGFVLAYVDKEYPVGTPLTCTEDGRLTEIKKSDKIEYPEKIIATFWKPEKNKTWGSEGSEIQVNGRMWVKVK